MTEAPLPAPAAEGARVLVVVAGSAGAIHVLQDVLRALPADLDAAIAVVQHRTTTAPNLLAEILQKDVKLRVDFATDGARLEAGSVYVAPPDRHLTIAGDKTLRLVDGHRIRHVLSSANPLFESAARVFGANVLAIVLTGYDADGTDGVQAVAAHGGLVLAQDPATARAGAMPRSAIGTGAVTRIVSVKNIAAEIERFARTHA